LRDYVSNRRIIGYPNPDDVSKSIEDEYKKEDKVPDKLFFKI
jgi:hypothetical protein